MRPDGWPCDEQLANVSFRQGDIYQLPYRTGSFDHVFVCFVLEHLADPLRALAGISAGA
jgi:ubiquinone/menaquinone biosynthesis C-methylase UbiE